MTIRGRSDQLRAESGPAHDCPVLLLHGFGQTGAAWSAVVEHLGQLRCLAPDMRGHGAASGISPIDTKSLVGDIVALASGTRPILVGYSMGGRLALRAALSHPSLFRALVLVSTTAGIEDPKARETRLESDARLAEMLQRGDAEAFEREWQRLPLWLGDPDRVSTSARQMRSLSEPAGLAESLRGFGSGSLAPVWDRLGEIEIPTTVMAGERDISYCDLAARLAALIPHSSLTIVPDCGHSIPLERPEAVARQIEGVSRRLRPEES